MMNTTLAFVALALLLSPVAAVAQSPLAEVARREAARREALKAAAVPTYTNEDLERLPVRRVTLRPPLPPPATEVRTAGVGGAETPAAPEAEAEAPRDEKYWRDRITAARANLSRAEIFAESLQSRINALSTDFVNRDDPAERQKIAEDRQRALDELARVQTEIGDFRKAIADIEDEARRLGVPPGWLR